MTDPLFTFLSVLDELREHRADPSALIASAPPVGTLPPPQVTWPLLGLMHYGKRVRRAWKVMRKRLRPQLDHHLDRPARSSVRVTGALQSTACEGIVPGLPDWEFCLDGNGSYLRHRGTQEYPVVDVLNGPDVIMEDGLISNYQSRRDPGPADLRLRDLFPDGKGLHLVLHGVYRPRCIVHCHIEGAFELCRSILDCADAAEAFLLRLTDPAERLGLLAAIGDWPAAHDAAVALGRNDLAALTAPRAEACRQDWLQDLRKFASKKRFSEDVLFALAHAGAEDLPAYIDRALADPALTFATMKVIAADPSWCGRVFELLTQQPTQFFALDRRYALYLARHCHRVREVIEQFRTWKEPQWDVLIRLALAGAQELLPDFLRSSLRSPAQDDRLTGAAVLALLDSAWGRLVLTAHLNDCDSHDATIECRAALRECRGPRAAEAADRWEAEHAAQQQSPEEFARMQSDQGLCASLLRDEMAALADAVRQVRGHLTEAVGV